MPVTRTHKLYGRNITTLLSNEGVLMVCNYGNVDDNEKRIEVFSSNGMLSLCRFGTHDEHEYRLMGNNLNKYQPIPCDCRHDINYMDDVDHRIDMASELCEILQMKYDKVISHKYELLEDNLSHAKPPHTFTAENYDISIDDGFLCIDGIKYTVCDDTLSICRLGGKYLDLMVYRLAIVRRNLINKQIDYREYTSGLKSARFI